MRRNRDNGCKQTSAGRGGRGRIRGGERGGGSARRHGLSEPAPVVATRADARQEARLVSQADAVLQLDDPPHAASDAAPLTRANSTRFSSLCPRSPPTYPREVKNYNARTSEALAKSRTRIYL